MRSRKCRLCGGKLNQNSICVECGFDNIKFDGKYHTAQKITRKEKSNDADLKRRVQSNRGFQRKRIGKKALAKILVFLTVVLTIFGYIPSGYIQYLASRISEEWDQLKESVETRNIKGGNNRMEGYDPYEDLTREFEAGGETYGTVLCTGEYIVGVHIPEGRYTMINPLRDCSSISIEDEINDIWMNWSLDEEEGYEQEDIRLFLGARLRVYADSQIRIMSENAQTSWMSSMENPLKKTVALNKETMTAGVDFEPGIYDIVMENGSGSLDVEILNEAGENFCTTYMWLDAGSGRRNTYKNIVIPAGARIICTDENVQVALIPAEEIAGTEYASFYTEEYVNMGFLTNLLDNYGDMPETESAID